jgi:hypothetical protein
LSDTWPKEQKKLLNKIVNCYRKAPYFSETYPVIEKIMMYKNDNLFDYLYNSIKELMSYMKINTELVVSSTLEIDNNLTSEKKVLAICKVMKAKEYINPIGGTELYKQEGFIQSQVNLKFLETDIINYSQFNNVFIPWLSIIDILMFNPLSTINDFLSFRYQLIQ